MNPLKLKETVVGACPVPLSG